MIPNQLITEKPSLFNQERFTESMPESTTKPKVALWDSSELLRKLSQHMMSVEENSKIIRQNLLNPFSASSGRFLKKEMWY